MQVLKEGPAESGGQHGGEIREPGEPFPAEKQPGEVKQLNGPSEPQSLASF